MINSLKLGFGVLLLALLTAPAWAGNDAAFTIKMRSGDELKCENVSFDADGNLSFTRQGKTMLLNRSLYDYIATAAQPEPIRAALTLLEKKDYEPAAAKFAELAKTYAYCGWDAFCLLKQAEALNGSGESGKAIELLSGWNEKELSGPSYRGSSVEQGRLLLARLYAQTGERIKAVKQIDQLLISDNDGVAASAFNLLGDMLVKEGHEQDAVLCYLRPVVLFDRTVPEREYALRRVCEMLEKMKDSRSTTYRDMLRREYSAVVK